MKLFQRLFFSLVSAGGIYFLSGLLGQGRSSLEEYAVYAAIALALVILAYNLSKLLTERDDERPSTGLAGHNIFASSTPHALARNSGQPKSVSAPMPTAKAIWKMPHGGSNTFQQDAPTDGTGPTWIITVALLAGGIFLVATGRPVGFAAIIIGVVILPLLLSARYPADKATEKALKQAEKKFFPQEHAAETAMTSDPVMDPDNPADARWRAIAAKRDAMVERALKEAEKNIFLNKNGR